MQVFAALLSSLVLVLHPGGRPALPAVSGDTWTWQDDQIAVEECDIIRCALPRPTRPAHSFKCVVESAVSEEDPTETGHSHAFSQLETSSSYLLTPASESHVGRFPATRPAGRTLSPVRRC